MTQDQPTSEGDDDRVHEGLKHLQTATQEVIAAVRIFLDAAEEVVSDPSSAASIFTGLGDVARSAGAARPGGASDVHDSDNGDDPGVQRIPVT